MLGKVFGAVAIAALVAAGAHADAERTPSPRAAKAVVAAKPAESADLEAALSRADVKAELAAKVRGVSLSPGVLSAYGGPDSDAAGVEGVPDAAPVVTAAQISALKARQARAAPQVAAIGPSVLAQPKRVGAVKPGPGALAIPAGPTLNVNAFGQDLHNALKASVAGYMMRLRKNGTTIYTLQWNWAQTPADGGFGWNPNRRMHVASVSKLMTGIAMTKLLDSKGISYDAKILGYLPAHWSKDPDASKITFRHLMTHRSGISTGGSEASYAFARQQIANNVNGGTVGAAQGDYENVNFSLQRILIGVIGGYIDKSANFGAANDALWNAITNIGYIDYMNKNIFGPSGVSGVSLSKPAGPAFAYTWNGGSGWNSGNLAGLSGGVGWHMSVDEVLNVMTALRKGKLMAPSKAQSLLDASFGLDSGAGGVNTPAGRLYHKNGRWRSGGRTEQCVAFFLPEGMELVVFVNSDVGANDTFLRSLVQQLYVDNIVAP